MDGSFPEFVVGELREVVHLWIGQFSNESFVAKESTKDRREALNVAVRI